MKKLMMLQKKLQKTKKMLKTMAEKLRKIWLASLLTFVVTSCGSTRVSVDKPNAGSYTTITVTTNNPITTDVQPNTTATLWDKK